MIEVKVNEARFDYDIRALVKAFYPKEELQVSMDSSAPLFCVEYFPDRFVFYETKGAFRNEAAVSEDMDRPKQKNLIKKLIYTSLRDYLGKELPWGDLSGIRPTRIPMTLLEEGKSEDEILAFMKETYLISDEKGRLSIEIAKREREVVSQIHYKDGYSIYIGIPFCPTTCLYCSFTSNPAFSWRKRIGEYLLCVKKELEFTKEAMKDKILDTIYIGGGTPTTLEAEELEVLMGYIEEYFDVTKLLEFTVEAGRPDSITEEKLRVLKKHHVTRISVNPQTMNQKTLDIIGRRHTVEDLERAYKDARAAGFDNINMDIILGLPGEGTSEVTHTLKEIERLAPDSLTVHSLAIKRASRLGEWIEENGYETMINSAETMKLSEEYARRMGLNPYYLYRQKNMAGNYENTGYAKEGLEGIYNILIMEELETIIACGAGTVTKRVYPDGHTKRCDTHKDVELYMECIDEMIDRKRQLLTDQNAY